MAEAKLPRQVTVTDEWSIEEMEPEHVGDIERRVVVGESVNPQNKYNITEPNLWKCRLLMTDKLVRGQEP